MRLIYKNKSNEYFTKDKEYIGYAALGNNSVLVKNDLDREEIVDISNFNLK